MDRPELMVLDIDASLVTSHAEKEEASGNYKHGFGFHPLACFLEATGDALSAILRRGSAGSNTARDHIKVFDLACEQLPEWVQEEPILVRCDTAGATHDFLNAVRAREKARFSVGFELREEVREAILKVPEQAWQPAIRQDAEDREGADVCKLEQLDLSSWPMGHSRHLPPRAPAPRRPALLHGSRRLALPGLHHRPEDDDITLNQDANVNFDLSQSAPVPP